MTRQQKRASDAALHVEYVRKQLKPKQAVEFRSRAQALPVLIRTNGLLQTVVFLESKAESKPDQELLEGLARQLQAANLRRPSGLLSAAFVEMPYPEYARWQEEAVSCAAWLKRFAAALIPDSTKSESATAPEENA